ncbi:MULTISPECIES: hypothetical protein [unclassified Bradyrhizobium]|nr:MULTISPECIES: hypothetical protein [unclassified Bradyrhizobium]MCP3396659.1 hypothetical protein [Bradyrhizobium sp. CCGB20]MCP3405172.1 hypothetical protein [Bradyrhizobium sp. CCGB01]
MIQINGLALSRRQKWRIRSKTVFIIEVIGFATVVLGVPARVKHSRPE